MARPNAPNVIIIDGKITNGDHLRSYWRERHHREYFKSRAIFDIIKQAEQPRTINDRIENLEAISAEPGSIPRQYHDELLQIKGAMLHLQKKVDDAVLSRHKKDQSHY